MVTDLKNKSTTLNGAAKTKKSKEVWSFLRVFEKLLISKYDNILYRITTERTHLVLSKKLVLLVFTELHANMSHLSKDRTLQLIRDCFYWPKMEDDIAHFVTKIYNCVEKKKPHIVPIASMQSFSSGAQLH